MPAKEELLGDLHDAVARDLLRKVQSGEASAQELNAAIKFLKDNNIEALRAENSPLDNLAKSLPDFDTEEEGLYAN
jgi:CHAD domain-containing protein